jgi:hypothetical protein
MVDLGRSELPAACEIEFAFSSQAESTWELTLAAHIVPNMTSILVKFSILHILPPELAGMLAL